MLENIEITILISVLTVVIGYLIKDVLRFERWKLKRKEKVYVEAARILSKFQSSPRRESDVPKILEQYYMSWLYSSPKVVRAWKRLLLKIKNNSSCEKELGELLFKMRDDLGVDLPMGKRFSRTFKSFIIDLVKKPFGKKDSENEPLKPKDFWENKNGDACLKAESVK